MTDDFLFDVFLSHNSRDKSRVRKLAERLRSAGLCVWFDEWQVRAGDDIYLAVERGLESSRTLLLFLSESALRSDWVALERSTALFRDPANKGRRFVPVLLTECKLPDTLRRYKYIDLRNDNPTAFEELLATSQADSQSSQLHFNTLPPLPPNYVERPEAIAALREKVLNNQSSSGIALTALDGMGGIGKTVLAQALCRDRLVQERFPDGIVWITVGRESAENVVDRLQEVAMALGEDLGEIKSEDKYIAAYRNMIQKKAALVILDDVWRADDVEPFRADGPGCLLFTTRDHSIGNVLGAEAVQAALLNEEQSLEILARWAFIDASALPPEARDLVNECGRLPLALSVVGAHLREKPISWWGTASAQLKNAELEELQMKLLPHYPRSLAGALQVSVDALQPKIRERYLALAVVLEDVPVHPVIQQALWATNEYEAAKTAQQLVERSLAQREDNTESFRLHDLLLDYIRAQYPDQQALNLIHGAMRLSLHVITKDPRQFGSQLVGRLLSHRDEARIQHFVGALEENPSVPWLRPRSATLDPPDSRLLRTLQGHSGEVMAVQIFEFGRLAISGSVDRTLRVWNLNSGRELYKLEGHPDRITDVVVTSDGRRAISGSRDGTLIVWDLESHRALRVEQHVRTISKLALLDNNRVLVSASNERTVWVWDIEGETHPEIFASHSAGVLSVSVSPDLRYVGASSRRGDIWVWDSNKDCNKDEPCFQNAHSERAQSLALVFMPDGNRLISACRDKTLKVWDLNTNQIVQTLEGHSHEVHALAVSSDGRRVVSGSWDKTLKVWALDTGKEASSLSQRHSGYVNAVALSEDGSLALSASETALKMWNLSPGVEDHVVPQNHDRDIYGIAITPDGKYAVSAGRDKTVRVWDLTNNQPSRILGGHSLSVYAVAVTPDMRLAVSASADARLVVWDLEGSRALRVLQGHSDEILGVSISPDGRLAISASADKTLRVWNVDEGSLVRELNGHEGTVFGVAMTSDSKYVVSTSKDRTVRIWDLETGGNIKILKGHSDDVHAIAINHDGRVAISASKDKTLRLWSLETGSCLYTMMGHSDSVNAVALNYHGRAVSASSDHTLRIWDIEMGGEVTSFTCEGKVHCCAFSHLGSIVGGDALGRMYLLELVEETRSGAMLA